MGRRISGDDEYRITNDIQLLRTQFNINQKDLADQVGVTRQTIYSMENGSYSPSLLLAYKIAQVFNKRIEDVFHFEKKDEDDED